MGTKKDSQTKFEPQKLGPAVELGALSEGYGVPPSIRSVVTMSPEERARACLQEIHQVAMKYNCDIIAVPKTTQQANGPTVTFEVTAMIQVIAR